MNDESKRAIVTTVAYTVFVVGLCYVHKKVQEAITRKHLEHVQRKVQ